MLNYLLHKIIGSKNERELRQISAIVSRINDLEPSVQAMSDDQLKAKTPHFRQIVERHMEEARQKADSLDDESKKKALQEAQSAILDDILPEAFAVVREVSRRTLGERHFDVQLIGGYVLHKGKIAEMKTGEGKTLASTLPVYLNALTGRGVHVVTVNDYLARRDAEWMGVIYRFLGISVGVIVHDMSDAERKQSYQSDITYGTNNEFGFDYLRDNMKFSIEECVQRELHYAIVDEVDSILIDEARTPLIISGPVEHSSHRFDEMKSPVERVVRNQVARVNRILKEAEALLENNQDYEAGIKLLQAKRGAPKNRRFLKLLEDASLKKLVERVELDRIRDRNMHELDEDLLFTIDERGHVVDLTDLGRKTLAPHDPNFFVIPDLDDPALLEKTPEDSRGRKREELEAEYMEKSQRLQNITQLLRAYTLFEKDVEYVVKDGQIVIVDEFTGRLMPGRRYSDGLHQALEAKEGVRIERENQTLATITFQNYFRMYDKLAGMTGTADTEAAEFRKIYNLDVVVIPTNRPMIRNNFPDAIYKSQREKFRAVIQEIEECYHRGQPVLVGTVSVDKSEMLSRMLRQRKIPHEVLNAKNHAREAEIIAQAGQRGHVTISTNMAGRGTDIRLGEGVVELGGLHVIGTERHESRRIDNQLRGRSGRQGDPGSSRFYLSLEDDLMRIFASDRIANLMERIGMEEDIPIEHNLVTRAIENAQKKVEAHNFEIRKHLLEYDDVMNRQREVIYSQRRKILTESDLREDFQEIIRETVEEIVAAHANEKAYPEDWKLKEMDEELFRVFGFRMRLKPSDLEDTGCEALKEMVLNRALEMHASRENAFGPELMRWLEKFAMLETLDSMWKDHLLNMDLLKEGIGLRGYGQRDPLKEYQREGFELFMDMIERMREGTVSMLYHFQIKPEVEAPRMEHRHREMVMGRGGTPGGESEGLVKSQPVRREGRKVGRNEPCPCGSGKKFKRCCGR
ncbi:MAG: preprotein translocase subunit SecA [Deltaproteobacteria bacterium]|nr:preprotein translocase subunit SecA [Deltaproteobacteria bacterium]